MKKNKSLHKVKSVVDDKNNIQMKRNVFLLFAILFPLLLKSQTDAFPGAEGFGRYTTGGRGGKIIYVTNLNDSGTGSLRWAVSQSGARTILFKVSGNIELESDLEIKQGDLTIAGQSAPGDGITIKNFSTVIKASNVIVRFVRFRLGKERIADMADAEDAFWGKGNDRIIIDHCSMSWSIDECASFYDNTNFTMQWCFITESLRNAGHSKGSHGYGGIWGGRGATFHHNLLANHDSRNARFCGSRYSNLADQELVDFRNNVIYNWGANNAYAAEGGRYNLVNNYYKPGPASYNRTRLIQPYPDNGQNSQPAGVWGRFFVEGNISSESETVTDDNWQGVTPSEHVDAETIKSDVAFTTASVTTHTAQAAYQKVLDLGGASYRRDDVDKRIVKHTLAGTFTAPGSNMSNNGLIDSQEDVGGWPILETGTATIDSDNDGMPDEWETAHGLNPNIADNNLYSLDSKYTNVEVYLNSLVQDIMDEGMKEANDNTTQEPIVTYNTWDFDTLPDGWVESTAVANGDYAYNGMTIMVTNGKVRMETSRKPADGSDENTSVGGLNTGGSNQSVRLEGLKKQDIIEIWIAATGDITTPRGVKITDGEGNSESYMLTSENQKYQVRKFTHTLQTDGPVIITSIQSVLIYKIKTSGVNSSLSVIETSNPLIQSAGLIEVKDAHEIAAYTITGALIQKNAGSILHTNQWETGIYLIAARINNNQFKRYKIYLSK